MTTPQDVPAEALIEKASQSLKQADAIEPPEWAAFARTGAHTERPPERDDWWWIRTAAVLRKVYTDGPLGTERLAGHFGGKKDRGAKPHQSVKGSRNVIRTALQQLEEAGYVEQTDDGRKVTPEGQSFLDNVAHEVKTELEAEIPGLEKY